MARAHERKRAALRLELALVDEHEALDVAKEAHAEQQTEESRAAKKAAMASLYETRQWLRAKKQIADCEQDIAALGGRSDDEAVATREALLAELAELHAKYDPLIRAMAELGAGMVQGSADPLPPGSVTVKAPLAKGRASVRRAG